MTLNSLEHIFFTGCCLLCLGYGCKNNIEEVNLITKQEKFPDLSNKDIISYYSDSGTTQARLESPLMNHYPGNEPYIEFPKGLHLVFFDDEMGIESSLTADYAIQKENEKIVEVKKNVVVVNKKGEQINSEHLIWETAKKRVYSNVFVKIRTAEEIIFGEGFESNEDFSRYKIFKIKGTIQIKK